MGNRHGVRNRRPAFPGRRRILLFSYLRIFDPLQHKDRKSRGFKFSVQKGHQIKKKILALFSKIAAKPAGNLNPRDSLVGGRKAFTFSRELQKRLLVQVQGCVMVVSRITNKLRKHTLVIYRASYIQSRSGGHKMFAEHFICTTKMKLSHYFST